VTVPIATLTRQYLAGSSHGITIAFIEVAGDEELDDSQTLHA